MDDLNEVETAWSWKTPTVPGWYWFKPKTQPYYVKALRLYRSEELGTTLWVACDRFSRLTSPYYEGGSWQKIPEPLP